jgi:Uma2 family endonuclease
MQNKTDYYTPGEYLELEEKAEYKSEYRDGKIVAMSANTTNHNHLLGNLAVALHFALRKKDYHVYIIGLRLWIPRYSNSWLGEVRSRNLTPQPPSP